MKGILAAGVGLFFLVELTLCSALGQSTDVTMKVTKLSGEPAVEGVLCQECFRFTSIALQGLFGLILNGGIMATCGSLCGALANKTGSEIIGATCQILCSAVGIKTFVDAVLKADLDPVYMCELLHECQINDNGDASINSVDVVPASGPSGSTFNINVIFTTENGTGPGQFLLKIDTVDGADVGGSFFHDEMVQGTYKLSLELRTVTDPDSSSEKWKKGKYIVHFSVCNGECGSKHPHSQIYDTGDGVFHITNDPNK